MKRYQMFKGSYKTSLTALTTGLLLSSCSTMTGKESALSDSDRESLQQTLLKAQVGSRVEIANAIELMTNGDYKEASYSLNKALMDDPKNPSLHFLNGMAYHLRSERGDGDYYDLALQGYTTALQFDPTNWQASQQLGRLMLRQKRFTYAQEAFADVLLYNPDNVDAYHNLAIASYYAQDVPRALAYARVAVQKDPKNPILLKSAALISAAANEPDMAKVYLDRYKIEEHDVAQERHLESRINDWNKVYSSGYIDRVIAKHKEEEVLMAQQAKLDEIAAKQAAEEYEHSTRPYDISPLTDVENFAANTSDMADDDHSFAASAVASDQIYQDSNGSLTRDASFKPGQETQQAPTLAPPVTTAPKIAPPAVAGAKTAAPKVAPPPAKAPAPAVVPQKIVTPPAAPAQQVGSAKKPDTKGSSKPAPKAHPPVGSSAKMVLLDGVVMRVSEDGRTNKGNNILDNLTVAATLRNSVATVNNDGTTYSNVRTYNRQKSFNLYHLATGLSNSGALTNPLIYSLNIANAYRQYAEVIGRPTLAVTVGKEGDFYSGDDRWLPVKGDRGGNVEKIPIGIGLTVTPVSIDGDTVTLKVSMQGRSVLKEPDTSLSADVTNQYLILASSYVKTEVKAKIGETVVLAGIKLRSDIHNKNGFPFLQDVPGVQYFFSNEDTNSTRRTVLYMLTVRGYGKDIQEVNATFQREEINQPAVTELDERHNNWFRPRSNTLAMLRTLSPVYREFRTGDLTPVNWVMNDNPMQMLTESGSFLYY